MNDFSELEKELRKLRPAQPSPVLLERVSKALGKSSMAFGADHTWNWRRFTDWTRQGARDVKRRLVTMGERGRTTPTAYNWVSVGFGLAAAAVLILVAAVTLDRRQEHLKAIAQTSPPPSQTQPAPLPPGRPDSRTRFVPAGGMNVVYNARDEGLHFADGSERPLRRVRYNTQQTWRWRNPETGASLRVSYPSEQIVLIPVSGQ